MNRNLDVCRKCGAMKEIIGRTGLYACFDACTLSAGGWVFCFDSGCTESEWAGRKVPEGCRMYAEHFIEECNNERDAVKKA